MNLGKWAFFFGGVAGAMCLLLSFLGLPANPAPVVLLGLVAVGLNVWAFVIPDREVRKHEKR